MYWSGNICRLTIEEWFPFANKAMNGDDALLCSSVIVGSAPAWDKISMHEHLASRELGVDKTCMGDMYADLRNNTYESVRVVVQEAYLRV